MKNILKNGFSINRTNLILLGVLVVQILLTILMFIPRTSASPQPSGPLVKDFKTEDVVGISLRDNENKELLFAKNASGQWVIPNADDYPVSTTVITGMLDKIKALNANRVIAQSSANYNRLKVGNDTYERLVEIKRANATDRLYVGSSTGSNAYMRLNDDQNVYLTSGLPSWDISLDTGSYIDADASYFAVAKDQVTALRIDNPQGSFQFRKVNGTWTWEGLAANEVLNTGALERYVDQITAVRLTRALGKTEQESYGIKKPSATVVITSQETVAPQLTPTTGIAVPGLSTPTPGVPPVTSSIVEKTYTLLVGAKLDSGDYVIKSSESPYFVQIAPFNAETFINLKRSDLVAPPTSTPVPSETPVPSVTPTPSPTPAVTATPTAAATATATP